MAHNEARSRDRALLLRGDELILVNYASKALRRLKSMHSRGLLQPVSAWTNTEGQQVTAWSDSDGSVLDCYVDMLGLNGRTMRTSSRPD